MRGISFDAHDFQLPESLALALAAVVVFEVFYGPACPYE